MSCQIVLFLLILNGFFTLSSTVKTASEPRNNWGPYTSVAHNPIKKCEKPRPPYSKDPAASVYVTIKNNYVRGNYTSHRENHNTKITMEDFYYEDGKLVPTFSMKNLSCRNQLLAAVGKTLGFTYNKRTCAVPKGVITLDFDYNKMDHMFVPSRQYGRMMRRLQLTNRLGTILCKEVDVDVVPEV